MADRHEALTGRCHVVHHLIAREVRRLDQVPVESQVVGRRRRGRRRAGRAYSGGAPRIWAAATIGATRQEDRPDDPRGDDDTGCGPPQDPAACAALAARWYRHDVRVGRGLGNRSLSLDGGPDHGRHVRLGGEQTTRGLDQRATRVVAILLRLRERLGDHSIQPVRVGEALDGRWRIVQLAVDRGDVGIGVEGHASRETLEQHAAERIDIGPPVDRLTGDLLRGHVVDGADELPRAGQPGTGRGALGDTEVRKVRALEHASRVLH